MHDPIKGCALTLVVAVALLFSSTGRANDAARTPASHRGPAGVIHVRKIVRTILHVGQPYQDKHPIYFGPAEMQLHWRRSWNWTPSYCSDLLPQGLRGGPMLSIALPMEPLARLLSIEARLSVLEYSWARRRTQRIAIHELADPQRDIYGMEAGLFVNVLRASLPRGR